MDLFCVIQKKTKIIITRPGVAGAGLQTASLLTNELRQCVSHPL